MKKTVKVIALAGALSVGAFTGAHAQAVTSATLVAAEAPAIVGVGANVAFVAATSTVSGTNTFTVTAPVRARDIVGHVCMVYDPSGTIKPLRVERSNETFTVRASTNPSGTLAVGDTVNCIVSVRP